MMLDSEGSRDVRGVADAFYSGDGQQLDWPAFADISAGMPSLAAGSESNVQNCIDPLHALSGTSAARPTVSLSRDQAQQAAPTGISGALDNAFGGPDGAKFAMSQVHRAYFAIRRFVLSRCAPWGEFFSSASFQRPGTGAVAVDRMERNVRYFNMNYMCICSGMVAACAFLNPSLLVIGGICGALCAFASLKGQVQIGDTAVPTSSFQRAVCLGGGCFILFFAGNVITTLLVLCGIVVLVHATLHAGVSYEKIVERSAGAQAAGLGV